MVFCHSHLYCSPQDACSLLPLNSFSLLGLSCSWWSVLSTWAPASYPHAPGGQLQPLQLTLTSLPSGSSRYVGVWAGAAEVRRAGMECLLDTLLFGFSSLSGPEGSGGGVLFHRSLAAQVLVPVACVWIISALLGLSVIPLRQSAPTDAPWFQLPHPGRFLLVFYPLTHRNVSIFFNSRFNVFHF